jgi:hypothetical protein
MRADQAVSARREVRALPPTHPLTVFAVAVVLLDPGPPQYLHGRQLPQPVRRVGPVDGLKQRIAVGSRLHRERPAFCLALRQPAGVGALPVTLLPGSIHEPGHAQPVRGSNGEGFQRAPQRPGAQLQPVQVPHQRQDMGGIRAHATTSTKEPQLGQSVQQPVQDHLLLPVPDQALAEAGQDQKWKPTSSNPSPSRYFQPILPRTASAACRSVSRSANCTTDTTASIPGASPGPPRDGKAAAKSAS